MMWFECACMLVALLRLLQTLGTKVAALVSGSWAFCFETVCFRVDKVTVAMHFFQV